MSLISGNTEQLASSITRLVQEVYPKARGSLSAQASLCMASNDILTLFHQESTPVSLWSSELNGAASQVQRQALFKCIWLMESLCSTRPGNLQEYLQRKLNVERELREIPESTQFLDFVHSTFVALLRNDCLLLSDLLTCRSNRLPISLRDPRVSSSVFWLRVMMLQLIPRFRAQAELVMRRSFLRIPVRHEFVKIINESTDTISDIPESPSNETSIRWLESTLLLDASLESALTIGFEQNAGEIKNDVHVLQSLLLFTGISKQFGYLHWDAACSSIRPRLVEANQSYALSLRP